MKLILKSLVFDKLADQLIGMHIFKRDGDDKDGYLYNHSGETAYRHKKSKYKSDDAEIDLSALTKKECEKLLKLLDECGVHGSRVAAADVRKYLKVSKEGITEIRARTCRQAAWMLELFFSELPHHTIFSKDEYGGNSHSGYYVSDIDYEPEKPGDRNNNRRPEYAHFDIFHIEDDNRHKSGITLYREDCLERTCVEILADRGFVPESPALMEKLAKETERFYREIENIGKQCVTKGIGLVDLDDALIKSSGRDSDSYAWGRKRRLKLDHFGETRVVIDVLKEKDDDENGNSYHRRTKRHHTDTFRWHKWNMRFHATSEDELVRHLEADEDTAETENVEIPVHPLIPCFDLRRHVRLRVHVNNLTKYEYNTKNADRLILPDRDWQMINLLVDHSANTFEDIVANKGRSMNILCVGKPGTGKTATAEVFAEFKGRPLYTIQCSQLGMDALSVEHNLGVIMERANRWNAVLLLDEADVYIHKRNTNLEQNAIVGAFLRVLEYASCILFMTTNLGDEVDDAITSRCIAKLCYESPGTENQAKIWRILADINGLKVADREIKKISVKYPEITGRDVKNLLKLASFVVGSNGKVLDAKVIEYAMIFKPTE